jgi:signal peptidase I
MRRALGLIITVVACIIAFLSIRGAMPFMPIFGHSMDPTLHSGGLLMIDPVEPQDIKVGDIIVYNVPSMVRDYYNYPPTVAHRVIKVYDTDSLSFRTKGDNTGEDPFTIRPEDVRGTVGSQIPYLGLPLLFFQSQQGTVFVIIALSLLAFFLYGSELSQGGRILHRGIFAPIINEEKQANRVLTRKIEATEQKMSTTEQALEKFAAAVSEYAQHLSSHTSAIQGLSEASHELKRSAAEQNRVLMRLAETMGQPEPRQEMPALIVKPPMPQPEKPAPEAAEPVKARVKPDHGDLKKATPPGCTRCHPLNAGGISGKQR